MKFITTLIAAAALSAACSQPSKVHRTEEKVTPVNTVNQEAAREAKADYFTEVEFARGSTTLSENSRRSINNLLDRARGDGKLKEVSVLSWADGEYPSMSTRKLPEPQRKLADKRSATVEKFIDSLRYDVDVDTYNMAERPAKLGTWLRTRDARFKETMAAAGLPPTADEKQLPSKASKSVILVTVE